MVIVPVPEIEWPLDKLDKKFTAWQEKMSAQREERKAQREEEKREEKSRKRRGKRPVGGLTMKFVLATQNPKKLRK